MNLENSLSELRAVLRRRIGRPLQRLVGALGGRGRPAPRALAVHGADRRAPAPTQVTTAPDAGADVIVSGTPAAAAALPPIQPNPSIAGPADASETPPDADVGLAAESVAPVVVHGVAGSSADAGAAVVGATQAGAAVPSSDPASAIVATPVEPGDPGEDPAATAPQPAVAEAADTAAGGPAEAPPEVAAVATARPAGCPVARADPGLDALRQRVAALQTRVIDLEARKAEMERLLDEFAYRQYLALGDLLGEQLRLQHEALRLRAERTANADDMAAAAAAAAEHAAYRRAAETPATPAAELADDARDELKALYRAAAMRCHPDRVGEADKARAHEFFLRTQDAYRRGDLEAMRMIGRQLAADLPPADDAATPRERLQALFDSLGDKGVEILFAIEKIQSQAKYRLARNRHGWDGHFAELRERLEAECAMLRRRIARY